MLMPPTVPINHYGDSRNQQNRTARPILLFHANVFGRLACFEHSNFLKVKVLVPRRTQRRARRFTKRKSPPRQYSAVRRTARTSSKFNYELFNCNNFNIRYWSWNYRGCWHQTCPPIVLEVRFGIPSLQSRFLVASLYLVTTSLSQDW